MQPQTFRLAFTNPTESHSALTYVSFWHKIYIAFSHSDTTAPTIWNFLHIFNACNWLLCRRVRYDHWCWWPALCCDCLPEICINKLAVPACPRCCPGASAFAYRAVIGLPWVPSATAERVGGRQHHKWVLNWNLTAALHFICVQAWSKEDSDQREEEIRKT